MTIAIILFVIAAGLFVLAHKLAKTEHFGPPKPRIRWRVGRIYFDPR